MEEFVFTGKKVNALETDQNKITKIKFEDANEVLVENDEYIINTIPQSVLSRFLGFESRLDFRGIISTYISYSGINRIIPEPYNWLYFSDKLSDFNRITEPPTLTKSLNVGDEKNRTYLIAETTFDSKISGADILQIQETIKKAATIK